MELAILTVHRHSLISENDYWFGRIFKLLQTKQNTPKVQNLHFRQQTDVIAQTQAVKLTAWVRLNIFLYSNYISKNKKIENNSRSLNISSHFHSSKFAKKKKKCVKKKCSFGFVLATNLSRFSHNKRLKLRLKESSACRITSLFILKHNHFFQGCRQFQNLWQVSSAGRIYVRSDRCTT